MELAPILQKNIINFLISLPNIQDERAQRALIESAGLDIELQSLICFGGSSVQFFQLLISTILRYGMLKDDRNGLESVLDAAKNLVGRDKKEICVQLIDELRKISTSQGIALDRQETAGQIHFPPHGTSEILNFTEEHLVLLKKDSISFPLLPPIKIVDALKQLPRSGKKIRLEAFEPKIPIRSLYDHILSLAHIANCLLPCINHNIPHHDQQELGRCIAYHEINEILLGDIPSYTNLTAEVKELAKISAATELRRVSQRERERITNEFIALFLQERGRESLHVFNGLIEKEDHPVTKFFRVLDTIDPIIATWRYLYHFRGKFDKNIDLFLRRMKDFFENPHVKEETARYTEDKRICELIYQLQDRIQAKQYYLNPNMLKESKESFGLPVQVVSDLIEGRYFHFAE